jgi:hypothetical protein
MLFATNVNSPSVTERKSAERYEQLVYRTAKERRQDIEYERRWKAETARLAREEAQADGEEEAERQLWHRVKK